MKKTIIPILVLSVFMMISCKDSAQKNQVNDISGLKSENQGKVIQIDKASFLINIMDFEKNPASWVFKGEKPSVVDFYADWCRPCKIVAPIMEELAKEYEGKINIYKVNVDNEKELSQYFQVESIPSILFIPLTGSPTMQAGAMSKEQYKQIFDDLLLKKSSDTIN